MSGMYKCEDMACKMPMLAKEALDGAIRLKSAI